MLTTKGRSPQGQFLRSFSATFHVMHPEYYVFSFAGWNPIQPHYDPVEVRKTWLRSGGHQHLSVSVFSRQKYLVFPDQCVDFSLEFSFIGRDFGHPKMQNPTEFALLEQVFRDSDFIITIMRAFLKVRRKENHAKDEEVAVEKSHKVTISFQFEGVSLKEVRLYGVLVYDTSEPLMDVTEGIVTKEDFRASLLGMAKALAKRLKTTA